jgi:nucleolar pre-ribosomal-associated protein 1
MYPLIMRFLLQRAEVDTSDVPMLFASLYSTSDEWRHERMWIVRFIANGMVGSEDWKILARRHVWDLLATLFQASPVDKGLRRAILDVRGFV